MADEKRAAAIEPETRKGLFHPDSRLGLGFDASPLPMWVADERTRRFLAVNDAAIAKYGYARERFLAMRVTDLDVASAPSNFGRTSPAWLSGTAKMYRHRRADGTIIAVRLETNRIEFDGRSADLATATDVTEALAESDGLSSALTECELRCKALFESEQQSRQLLDAVADYYWEQDAQYSTTYLSSNYEKIMEISVSEALGKRLSEIPNVSIPPEMARMALSAYSARQPFRDFIYSRKICNEITKWYKLCGAPIFDPRGEFAGYRGIGADVTQWIETEAATRLSRQRLHEAVAYVTQPIAVYDAEDRLCAFNQLFCDLHRLPVDYSGPVGRGDYVDEIAVRAGQRVGFEDAAELQRRIAVLSDGPGNYTSLIREGVTFRELAEWQLSVGFYADGPDDPVIDLETLIARFRSETGHTYHLRDGRWMMVIDHGLPGAGGRVTIWTDISAIKQAEAERRSLEAQLHHALRLEALGTLAGGAAHEINNMLVPVLALSAAVAKKLPEGGRERRNLDTVRSSAERARELVNQILTFSRMEGAPAQSSVDVGAVLREALQRLRATVPPSIHLAEEIAPVSAITGDADQLRQVVVNLLTNAVQAIGQAQGSITASLQPAGADLRLSVADTGCGMEEAILARVFEPFFSTKPVGEGTGLGLAVAYGIVKAHGGRIEAKSTPGQGSRFDIFIPVPAAA
jgi:PAS domain S-box-containing protein